MLDVLTYLFYLLSKPNIPVIEVLCHVCAFSAKMTHRNRFAAQRYKFFLDYAIFFVPLRDF